MGAGVIPGAHAASPPLTVPGGIEFTTSVAGFAPGAPVEQRLDRRISSAGRADAAGVLHLRLVAPAAVGPHRLVLVGRGPDPLTSTPPAPGGGSPLEDPQAVLVRVPRVVTLSLVVVPAATVLPESSDGAGHGHGSGHGPTAGRGDGVASTGVDVLAGVALGAALALAGAVATWCDRRRPARGAPRRA